MDDDRSALVGRPNDGLLFDAHAWISDHQHHAVRFQVRPQRGSSFWFLETQERGTGFNHTTVWRSVSRNSPITF
jgi:hypothetical protein